jgi:excinuclease UvrABC nuclease subunit
MPISGDAKLASTASHAPRRSGVYVLYTGDDLIYIGRAQGGNSTIRSCLESHLEGGEGPCTQAFTQYRYETTRADVGRERELFREYKREHNSELPKCNDRIP